MVLAHGRQYRVKLVKPDKVTEYGDWFNTYDEATRAMEQVARPYGADYFMQEQNVVKPGEQGDPELKEYPISPL